MTVKLIAKTIPVDGCNDIQELVSYCARVSNPENQSNYETAEKLLKYLITNSHWSPFEMASLVFEINTTRDIARQILRHRSFSFQEFSQRYAKVDDNSFIVREARLQDKKNRQNSIESNDDELKKYWEQMQQNHIKQSIEKYNWALDNGIAKEQARVVLPEGLTMSRLYMSGTLRSWIHYCLLRMGNGTQKEHKLVAEEIWKILVEEIPFLASLKHSDLFDEDGRLKV